MIFSGTSIRRSRPHPGEQPPLSLADLALGRAAALPRAAGTGILVAGDWPERAAYRLPHHVDGRRRHLAGTHPFAAAAKRLPAGLPRLRQPDGLRVVSAVRDGSRALSAVHIPARRRDRHGARVSDRGLPQPGPLRRRCVCAATVADRRRRRGDRCTPGLAAVAAQTSGFGQYPAAEAMTVIPRQTTNYRISVSRFLVPNR